MYMLLQTPAKLPLPAHAHTHTHTHTQEAKCTPAYSSRLSSLLTYGLCVPHDILCKDIHLETTVGKPEF